MNVVYLYGGNLMQKNTLVGDAWRYDACLGTWVMDGNALESPIGTVAHEDMLRDPLSLICTAGALGLSLIVVYGGGLYLAPPSVSMVDKVYCLVVSEQARELEGLMAMHWLQQQRLFSMYDDDE